MKTLRTLNSVLRKTDRGHNLCHDAKDGSAQPGRCFRRGAFTLLELLVVIGIIGVLASLLLPVAAKAKTKARQTQCLQNHRQLALAWTMYTHENNDTLVRCSCNGYAPDNWVRGYLGLWEAQNPDNTNIIYLRQSPLAPYLGYSIGVWHCPSDKATVSMSTWSHNGVQTRQKLPLARSVAMNGWLNTWLTSDEVLGFPPRYRAIRKFCDMVDPSPSGTFAILDERADSIGDGWFGVTMGARGRLAEFWSLPASDHGGACNLSFADGHAETHKWTDPRTNPKMKPGVTPNGIGSPNNRDVQWLQEHATGLK